MRDIDFNDAQQALGFILPQQLRIETEVYKIKYPSFDYARLLPVITDGDMWDVGSVFFSGDIAGKAEFLSSKGFDMPYADIAKSQFIQTNQLAGIGYEWSLGELKRAEKLGQDLGADKAAAARKVAEQFLYNIALTGSTEKNWTGMINDANVPTANVTADGTGSTTSWDNKTALQILRDINAAIEGVYNNTLETEVADSLALPTSRLQLIARTPIGDNADKTILTFIRENNAYTAETGRPLNIKGVRNLETAGASSTKTCCASTFRGRTSSSSPSASPR
jgi:hypothetical protein